jgi:uncharacterized membrane protein
MTLTLRVSPLTVRAGLLNVRAISAIHSLYFQKNGGKKMNVSFEYSKTLAGEGAILLLLSLVPYAGWVLGIIGIVLLLRGMKELSNYYQDEEIYKNALTGVKYYIIAIIAAGVAVAAITIGVWTATGFTFTSGFVPTVAFGVGIIAFLAGLIIAFIFYILAASHLRRTFNTLAQKSGEESFNTAGTLLWIGALLSIILVGLVLIFVAWIFATIGFFAMKPKQLQQPYNPQQYASYTPPSSPQPEQGKVS